MSLENSIFLRSRRGVLLPEKLPSKYGVHSEEYLPIRTITEKSYAKAQEIHLVFIDVEKAYDSAPINNMWGAMENIGIGTSLITVIKKLYKKSRAVVKAECDSFDDLEPGGIANSERCKQILATLKA
ncbi:hypothetical protein ANN_13441 [Periplaneta americana]|uniref:Reverse transcriptase domain-containing protein n=1 Tax=Periplaneta americana TaxID=6978 RepID=A0ABQ8TJW8_PERAM|nr:hypothetical protein ANN_13441 [Periplaneta americana]